jgi:hypothetical protein
MDLLFAAFGEPALRVSPREMAGGRYAAGRPERLPESWFYRFASESMDLDG